MSTDSAPLRIAIIGSTGSLGQIVLSVARSLGDNVRIVGLAAGSNLERLAEQIQEYKPTMAGFARGRWRDETPEGVRFMSIQRHRRVSGSRHGGHRQRGTNES